MDTYPDSNHRIRSGGRACSDPARKESSSSAEFPALTHVALTVRDLSVSVPWYQALFDAEPVLDEDTDPDFHHTVYLLGNTLLGLHQHTSPLPTSVQRVPGRSRPCRLRLRRPGRARAWVQRLDELGVDYGDIKDRPYGSGVSFRDPDGIALEFFAPPG